uniref:Uncharacterized protein n=1 Tax=Molossus molossus TaxID=27622 RepID=A0A7J8BYK0_MOLMO|nr:hypothetical protein HJG59_010074 [Molossus molossus]
MRTVDGSPPPPAGCTPCSAPCLEPSPLFALSSPPGSPRGPKLPLCFPIAPGWPRAPGALLPILPSQPLWNLPLRLHNDQQSKHQPQMQQRLFFLEGKGTKRRRKRIQNGRKDMNIADQQIATSPGRARGRSCLESAATAAPRKMSSVPIETGPEMSQAALLKRFLPWPCPRPRAPPHAPRAGDGAQDPTVSPKWAGAGGGRPSRENSEVSQARHAGF